MRIIAMPLEEASQRLRRDVTRHQAREDQHRMSVTARSNIQKRKRPGKTGKLTESARFEQQPDGGWRLNRLNRRRHRNRLTPASGHRYQQPRPIPWAFCRGTQDCNRRCKRIARPSRRLRKQRRPAFPTLRPISGSGNAFAVRAQLALTLVCSRAHRSSPQSIRLNPALAAGCRIHPGHCLEFASQAAANAHSLRRRKRPRPAR